MGEGDLEGRGGDEEPGPICRMQHHTRIRVDDSLQIISKYASHRDGARLVKFAFMNNAYTRLYAFAFVGLSVVGASSFYVGYVYVCLCASDLYIYMYVDDEQTRRK